MAETTLDFKKSTLWGALGDVVNASGWVLSVILAYFTFIRSGQNAASYVCSFYLIGLNVTLIIFIWIQQRQKLHRYSHIIGQIHYVNHIVRDELSQLYCKIETGIVIQDDLDLQKSKIKHILDIIANSFSIITGTTCRTCIKELRQVGGSIYVKTVLRDSLSGRKKVPDDSVRIEENSDFDYLLKNPHESFFFCNHIPYLWSIGQYKNSSLKLEWPISKSTTLSALWLRWPHIPFGASWPLPYKSTLIVPIRYMSISPPGNEVKIGSQERQNDPHYFGFLCIDSSKPNVFKIREDFHICAAFADILYLFFSHLGQIEEAATRPS